MPRPPAEQLKDRCKAVAGHGQRCGSPAVAGGLCVAHLGRLSEDERAELRAAAVQSATLLVHARRAAIGTLAGIIVSGSTAERLAACRIVLSCTASDAESRLANSAMLAGQLQDGDLGVVDGQAVAVDAGQRVRERLAEIAARKARRVSSPRPDPVDALISPSGAEDGRSWITPPPVSEPVPQSATEPGRPGLLPSVGPWVHRQLTAGLPVVVDADLDADPAAVSAPSVDIVEPVDISAAGDGTRRGHALPAKVRRRRPAGDGSAARGDEAEVVVVPRGYGVPGVTRRMTSTAEIGNRRLSGRGL